MVLDHYLHQRGKILLLALFILLLLLLLRLLRLLLLLLLRRRRRRRRRRWRWRRLERGCGLAHCRLAPTANWCVLQRGCV